MGYCCFPSCWIIFIFIRYWFWCHMNRYFYCILCSIWISYINRYFMISRNVSIWTITNNCRNPF
ncbi:hypothetical protein SAL_2264 [Streptococcus agalactiae 515]|nr:hypothetical protein SAL_2264 [Streptococcus agalactiae 515]